MTIENLSNNTRTQFTANINLASPSKSTLHRVLALASTVVPVIIVAIELQALY